MSWLKEKIAQIREYNRLREDCITKSENAMSVLFRWARASRAIEKEYPLYQHLAIEDSPDKFGLWEQYPCVVYKIGNEKYSLGELVNMDAKVLTCPRFCKDKVCDKYECMYNAANQEYVTASKDFDIAMREFNRVYSLKVAARKRVFGRENR